MQYHSSGIIHAVPYIRDVLLDGDLGLCPRPRFISLQPPGGGGNSASSVSVK
jgi:hypothetical protein